MTLIGDLIAQVNHNAKDIIRSLERTQKKIVNAENSVIFNRTCLEQGLLPKYSNVRLHDPAIRQKQCTFDFRRNLVKEQLEESESDVIKLKEEQVKLQRQFTKEEIDEQKRDEIYRALHDSYVYYNGVVRERISKKLNRLYGGFLYLKDKNDSFINLSSRVLSNDEKDFLNLGINCHIESKFSLADKYTEVELLFQQITELEREKKVNVKPELKPRLLAEATKHRAVGRGKKGCKVLTPRLRAAAKNLRQDDSIVIRKADKTSVYVILDKKDYDDKISEILSDQKKFQKIRADPTNALKKRVNGLIAAANAEVDGIHFKEVIGDYRP